MGTIDLVMKHLRMDFKEACRWLADENNVFLSSPFKGDERGSSKEDKKGSFDANRYEGFFLRPWLSNEARRFLFDERKLDSRVISWCKVSSWRDRNGVNWLQIPYYDMDGKLIGVQNRNLGPSQPSLNGGDWTEENRLARGEKSPFKGDLEGLPPPRFKFPRGSRCSIYNLPVLKMLKPGEELWITEGCSDCWAMLSAGHKAIAIPSATLLSPRDKEVLSPLSTQLSTEFHMYPDKDAPGERLFLQLKEILPGLQHHQLPMGCKDFSDYYVQLKSQHS